MDLSNKSDFPLVKTIMISIWKLYKKAKIKARKMVWEATSNLDNRSTLQALNLAN